MANTKATAIHVTAVKAFLKCRLAWYFSSEKPWGLYLEPITHKEALAYGTVIHKCMQVYYDLGTPLLETYEKVILDYDLFADTIELGRKMLAGYTKWAVVHDKGLKTIATETNWHVKVNRYWLEGTYDRLVEKDDGLWVMDFKTTASQATSWTATDLQATAYVTAARAIYGDDVRGIIFRFLRKKAPHDYHQLILKKGNVTTRKDIENNTTLENYLEALAVAVASDIAPFPEEAENRGEDRLDYYARILLEPGREENEWWPLFMEMFTNARRMHWDTLQKMQGTSPFFWDVPEYRTAQQIRMAARLVFLPAMRDMCSRSKRKWLGPTGLGTSIWSCSKCSFKTPCGLVMDGADYKTVLDLEYQERTPRGG